MFLLVMTQNCVLFDAVKFTIERSREKGESVATDGYLSPGDRLLIVLPRDGRSSVRVPRIPAAVQRVYGETASHTGHLPQQAADGSRRVPVPIS